MLISPALFFIGICFTFLVLCRRIQVVIQRQRNVQVWGCKAPTTMDTGFFGIQGFLQARNALKNDRLLQYVIALYREHGNTFQQKMLGKRVLNTIEPENVKAILATHFDDFSLGNRHREFYPLLGDGIFTLDGAGWFHSRALLRPQFTREQVADLDILESHVSRLLDLVPNDGSLFDIQRLFFLMTMDSATHFLFGESIGTMMNDDGKPSVEGAQEFAEAFNLSQKYLMQRTQAFNFYWMINPWEFREANRCVHKVVQHYVQLAIDAKSDSEETPKRYIFAQALAADSDDPKILRDNMLNVLLAGRDTTASLLSSAFFFLSRHPATWEKLQKIIIDEFGDSLNPKGKITYERLKSVPYLRYFLNEVLRLLPPVPINFRIATRDTFLPLGGGPNGTSPVYIEMGQIVRYNVYAMHRRKDLYGADAEIFRPERWEENSKRGWEFLPFNGGPRICLGQQYARTEASYAIVKIMQRYSNIDCGGPESREPTFRTNLTMTHGKGVMIKLY